MAKKKVFLSFVGERDPYAVSREGEKSEGAILTLCKEIKPDYIFLFPSGKRGNPDRNTEDFANQAKKILEERNLISCSGNDNGLADVTVMPLDVKDATDFEALASTFNDSIDKMLKMLGNPSDYEYHLNCSSGTQQMSALGYVFASSGRIPGITRWQCKSPDDAKREGVERNKQINTSFLEESAYRERIKTAFDHLNFPVIAENCKVFSKIASTQRQRDICDFLANLFSAYEKMDLLRYDGAYNSMNSAHEKWRELLLHETVNDNDNQYGELLNRQRDMLRNLEGPNDEETVINLTDIYFNMQRCLVRGAFADVLARFRRIVEGSLYYRLNDMRIFPRNWKKSPNRNLKKLEDYFEEKDRKPGRYLELESAKDALFEALDYFEYYPALTEDFRTTQEVIGYFNGEVHALNEIRNKTIIAHGMKPVTKEEAEKSLECARKVLCLLVPGTRQYIIDRAPWDSKAENYPFSRRNIRRWLKLL